MQTVQRPIGSGFDAFTTAAEVIAGVDLSGKVAIVTGGYSGLGLETARQLAGAGAEVFVPARSIDKARAQAAGIPRLTLLPMDLLDRSTVDAFADQFLATGRPLHFLINSAGIMMPPLFRDDRGNEGQFAVNHLGHFRLTQRLIPALERANGARVVSVSSRGHFRAGVDFDDPAFQARAYDPGIAYGQSKTANALFALGLDMRYQDRGVRAFSLHPGAIFTELMRNIPRGVLLENGITDEQGGAVVDPAKDRKSVPQGAATQTWCAISPQLEGMGGVYCEDCDIAWPSPADSSIAKGVRPWAMDPGLADRLWTLSEDLVAS
ncbi:SDR family NAD(P)-dependent oxidoreductase [Croceibacterium sp. LX-88]|jgi:NAD(P)-dependent dehydrogenase (short-subunit alcohol dehydrogenase family)|uniref:SDR family NAD(P)-dependent oxidoreductase n=1 Tax=Croceibacterium selenioxidans TaxID=2838833 RepID=A0ABS5W4D4_9SPHN|nr:SDR family NAD(P)-dependent oxidoreductase [Croceibacterium selenioxidans]MBT2134618.1 SDR family NAD(P)-dependent oxidoreductase [Croceibacterium selenioxidans]